MDEGFSIFERVCWAFDEFVYFTVVDDESYAMFDSSGFCNEKGSGAEIGNFGSRLVGV